MKIKSLVFKIMLSVFGARGFGKILLKSSQSPAYARFCEIVYGRNLCQFNMLDEEQLTALLSELKPLPTLDLGCGIGVISEYISDELNCPVVGVDFAPLAIGAASERTASKATRLKFSVRNMNSIDLANQKFDQVLALDSLYFVHDLKKLLTEILRSLRPGGRILAFYTTKSDKAVPVAADDTKLATALKSLGFQYKARNFTSNELEIWNRTAQAAEELKGALEKEGNHEIYKSRKAEAQKNLTWQKKGIMSRYLYVATRP